MAPAAKRPSSIMEMFGSPPVKAAAGAAKRPADGAEKKAALSGAARLLAFNSKPAAEAKPPAAEAKLPATPEKQPGPATSSNGKSQIDALTGKKLQRTVNEKKMKEEELKRAAELLQANAGKFAAALDAEGGEEPSDEAEDVGDETWDTERRLQVARAAWAAPPTAAAAAAPEPGNMAFAAVVPLLALAASGAGEAPLLRAVAELLRGLREAPDLGAALRALLGARAVPQRLLADAVATAFGLPRAALRACEDLPERAVAGRAGQRTLLRAKGASIAEVAAVLEAQPSEAPRSGDRLVRLLSSSPGGPDLLHLVRVLQGRPALTWDLVLRGLAHAAAPPGDSAQCLVALEDAVFRAYAQGGGLTPQLLASLLGGAGPEALVAGCPAACGAPVAFMRAQQPRDIQAALATVGGGAVVVEWLFQGDRAQVHVQAGKVVAVFTPSGSSTTACPDVVDEAAAALDGSLAATADCILDVVFVRGPRKSASSEDVTQEASPKDDAAAATEQEKSPSQDRVGKGRCIVAVDVLLAGGEPLTLRPLRERRARLAALLAETPRVRVAKGAELAAGELTEAAIREKLDEALSAASLATTQESKTFSRADGLVLKLLDGPASTYFAGRRVGAWQKLVRPPVTGQEADKRLLETLTEEEKRHIPAADEFHFTVVSGFRTRSVEGINDILRIQQLYNDAGVVPTWYVDNECPDEYRKLGLKVVKAGKLIPARNHALEDASKMNKVCVQTSDDIGSWTFYNDAVRYFSDEEANAAARRCEKLEVSPVAAARYLVAKMRVRGPGKCRLGGVYPLGNGGRAMRARPILDKNFILGDFFAAEVSPCRFDEKLSLKEDYDFTCSHLDLYGQVLRSNRLIITAKHETNAGGACAIRDAAGERERYNIGVLKAKWPDAVKNHPTRANQVVLRWKDKAAKRAAEEPAEAAEEPAAQRPAKQARKAKGSKAKDAQAKEAHATEAQATEAQATEAQAKDPQAMEP